MSQKTTWEEKTPKYLKDLAKSLGALRAVTNGDDYNNARLELFLALEEARKEADLQETTTQIKAVWDTTNKTFTGDVTRSLLIEELELLIQVLKEKADC